MRATWGVVLGVIATLIGASAAAWFSLAGVGWSGGFIERSYWEESEGEIGVVLAVAALVFWVLLLGVAFLLLRPGSLGDSPGGVSAAVLLTVVSVLTVSTLCVLSFAWPEPSGV